jgi:hypothetical protein
LKQSGRGVRQSSFAEGVRDSSSPEEFIASSSSRKLLRISLRQFETNEEPEEVTGLCDVIGNVISDC